VAHIAGMFGWTEFLGHLTSGGTQANLEALWVAGQLAPGRRIVGSEQAHYTHQRISSVLKLEYTSIAADRRGRMDMEALESELRKGDVSTVVSRWAPPPSARWTRSTRLSRCAGATASAST